MIKILMLPIMFAAIGAMITMAAGFVYLVLQVLGGNV